MSQRPHPHSTGGLIVLLLIPFLLQSCALTVFRNKIHSETDIVYKTQRYELSYYLKQANRRYSSISMGQSIVKKIDAEGVTTYQVYDRLRVPISHFRPDERTFLILDQEVFPISIQHSESGRYQTITEEKADLLTADSSSLSVVTGYNLNEGRIFRYYYDLPPATMEQLLATKEVFFRYYAGPEMLTFKIRQRDLKRLKKMIRLP